MSREREILQISLGSPACEVTSHLINLQGLAATSSSSNNDDGDTLLPYCEANVTHSVTNQLRVPRALLVDAPLHMHRRPDENHVVAANHISTAWSGQVEPLSVFALDTEEQEPTTTTTSSRSRTSLLAAAPWLQSLQDTSAALANSQFSRYRVGSSWVTSTATSNDAYTASSTNSRHVNWDDLDNEQEEDQQEETEQEQRERLARQRRQWQGGTWGPLQTQLDEGWGTILQETPAEMPERKQSTSIRPDNLLWTDYLAPPFHPRSVLSLPAFQDDAYFPISSGKDMSHWIEEDILERIRNMLEDCDACQGCVLSTSGFGIFAGLGTQVLHYLSDECPSASRVVLSYEEAKKTAASNTVQPENANNDPPREEPNWRSHYVETTRENVSKAAAWYDFWECAQAILPLRVPLDAYPSRFHAAAAQAAALEATTLPFRVRPNDRLRIGTNSYYYGSFSGDSDFGTVPGLSLSEFLSIVKPRDKLSVLEVDSLTPNPSEPLWPSIREGTSVERDHRMRESPHLVGARRPRDVLPGRWLLSPAQGGRLTSLSRADATDRDLHTHFALASAVRPSTIGNAPLHHYVDCLMQGMGIRFRPEQSAATVLDQSLALVTSDGYGAGSYWKSVWRNQPVLAVVGNTTRFYPSAHAIASNLKTALSPRSRGFYNRDVASGMLPEIEDCQEALSSMWDLRDLYRPPDGSGLVVDEEGEYFE